MLKDGIFDFIYIDGDHKYENVKSDILHAKRLINKKFGVICGDDLDKVPTEELTELSKDFKNRDFLRGVSYFILAYCWQFLRSLRGLIWSMELGGLCAKMESLMLKY